MHVKQVQHSQASAVKGGKAAANLLAGVPAPQTVAEGEVQFGEVLDQELAMAMMGAEGSANPEMAKMKAEQLMALQAQLKTADSEIKLDPKMMQNAQVEGQGEVDPKVLAAMLKAEIEATPTTPNLTKLDPQLAAQLEQVLQGTAEVEAVLPGQKQIPNQKNIAQILNMKQSAPVVQGQSAEAKALEQMPNALMLQAAMEAQPEGKGEKVLPFAAAGKVQAQSAYGLKKNLNAAQVGQPIMMNDMVLNSEMKPKMKGEAFKNYSQFTEKKMINVKGVDGKDAIVPHAPVQTDAAVAALAMKSENQSNLEPQLKMADQGKVLDMSKVDFSQGADKVIDQITNYVMQAKAGKEPTLDVKVQHEELGLINIHVEKTKMGDAVNLHISTGSPEANLILNTHKQELISNLSQAGVSLAEFKMDFSTASSSSASSFSSSHRDSSSGNNSAGEGSTQSGTGEQKQQFGSEQNQRKHDSERRQNLWDILNDKEAA